MVEIDYNKRAFLIGGGVFAFGVVLMMFGALVFEEDRLVIVGGILSLVAVLTLFLLGGLIFALKVYSEEDL